MATAQDEREVQSELQALSDQILPAESRTRSHEFLSTLAQRKGTHTTDTREDLSVYLETRLDREGMLQTCRDYRFVAAPWWAEFVSKPNHGGS